LPIIGISAEVVNVEVEESWKQAFGGYTTFCAEVELRKTGQFGQVNARLPSAVSRISDRKCLVVGESVAIERQPIA
jgi:hypothetical protein